MKISSTITTLISSRLRLTKSQSSVRIQTLFTTASQRQSYFNQFRDGTSIVINGETVAVPAVDERVEIMFTDPAIIGKAEMLKKGVSNLNGLVANPMQEAELSKIGLFQVADYIWNTADFDVDSSWQASFKYVDSDIAEEFAVLAANMSYPKDGVSHTTGLAWEESEYLADEINAILEKVKAGESIAEEAAALIPKLEEIDAAANTVLNCDNEALVGEITPYLNSLKATVEADIYVTKAVLAIEEGEKDQSFRLCLVLSTSDHTLHRCIQCFRQRLQT